MEVIWAKREPEYFCGWGWTASRRFARSGSNQLKLFLTQIRSAMHLHPEARKREPIVRHSGARACANPESITPALAMAY
jgi:putative endonuclease